MTAIDSIAGRLARAESLSRADAEAVLSTRDLIGVGMLADEVRRRRHGSRTTFVRVFEVHVDAPSHQAPSGLEAGEIRIVGAPASIDAAVAAVRAVVRIRPGVPVLGFSLPDLCSCVGGETNLAPACLRLREAGLSGIAAVPLDRRDAASAVQAARAAGLRVERLTVDALADDGRIESVTRARELQETVGEFRTFAPLARSQSAALPTTGYDDVRQVALARMVAENIPSIQVDWRLYGPKLAQVALTMGADDVDGVEAVEDGALGTRRSALAEIIGNIRAASLDPVERDGLFRTRG